MARDEEVLSPAELDGFDRDGYVVVKAAITRDLASRIEAHLFAALGMSPDDPDSWYATTPVAPAGPHYNVGLPATPEWARLQLELAQSPRLLGAYAQLWGSRDLWILPSKRGSFKPPIRPGGITVKHISAYGQVELPLGGELPMHFDVGDIAAGAFDDPAKQYFDLQSSLFVRGHGPDGGGTCLVPGFQRKWASWIGTPEGRQEIARMSRQESRHHPEMANVDDNILTPAGGPGDLLIWQNFLPHGSSVNTSAAPRMRLGVAVRPAPPPTSAYAAEYDEHRALWSEFLEAVSDGDGAAVSPHGRRALGLEAGPAAPGPVGARRDHSAAYLARTAQSDAGG